MRISLLLNSTMRKSCTQSHSRFQQERKSLLLSDQENKEPYSYEKFRSKQIGYFYSTFGPVSRVQQFPAFLSACYEFKWFFNSRTTFSQTLDSAIQQICSLSALLLFYLMLVLVAVQVSVLVLVLSYTVSLPLGFQFMFTSVLVISATAFQIMYKHSYY